MQSLMSVKTDLVKEFLVGRIQSTVAERHPHALRAEIEAALARAADEVSGDQAGSVDEALAASVARAGYLARVVETELFEPARQPSTALEGPFKRPGDEGDDLEAIASASAQLANAEPAERPKPDDPHAMTWRIPGPGGHVRHYLALDAIQWLAGNNAVGAGNKGACVELKRCWLYGFFLRACEEIATPES
jgi:hypothetical protein